MNRYSYRVFMQSRPAMGRTFYEGHSDVFAPNDVVAESLAINKVARVHGHHDWIITKIERKGGSNVV